MTPYFRRRRGGASTFGLVGLTTLMIAVGVELDACRLYITRHKDQVIADSAAMAAAQKLPYKDQSTAAADRVFEQYRGLYKRDFTTQVSFFPEGASVPTQVRVEIAEQVPMIFPGLMGTARRPTRASASASRQIPSAMLQGVVPLGVQYNLDFELPTGGMASSEQLQLKLGPSDAMPTKGNSYALDFPAGSGAGGWSDWMKWGYSHRLTIGQTIRSKTGQMSGPTENALVRDVDSRMVRARLYPYSDDTWEKFDTGNPRVVILPLVDWKSAKDGSSALDIKGFAAFWLDDYVAHSGQIFGRFIRYSRSSDGNSWDGVSIDTTGEDGMDTGFWLVRLTS